MEAYGPERVESLTSEATAEVKLERRTNGQTEKLSLPLFLSERDAN